MSREKGLCRIIRALLLFSVLVQGRPLHAACPFFSDLIDNGAYGLLGGDGISLCCQPDRQLIPASIIKIATSLAALNILGPDYRFITRIYLDGEKRLVVEGFGDPLLVSEEVERIARMVRRRGIAELGGIVIVQERFAPGVEQAPGSEGSDNPYDAADTALAVNFNSLPLRVDPDGAVHSAEPQTPFLPLMAELGKHLGVGRHRVNIDGVLNGKETLAGRYAGELFRAMLTAAGIRINGKIDVAPLPAERRLLFVHHSPPLREIVALCLRYSNNFIANQIFLTCGVARYGYPADWYKSRRVLARFFATRLGVNGSGLRLVEGSGLSPHNRVTVRGMLRILEEFAPYSDLLPTRFGNPIKSGTLTGVYNYAGYLGKERRPFVIILNQRDNIRDRLLRFFVQREKRRSVGGSGEEFSDFSGCEEKAR